MQKREKYVGENTQICRDGDLCLDLADDRVRCVSRNNLGVVQHVELLGGIATRIQKDSLFASGVVGQELEIMLRNFYGPNEMNEVLTLVTSRTCPSITTQTSSFLLCLATSARVYSPEVAGAGGAGADAAGVVEGGLSWLTRAPNRPPAFWTALDVAWSR